MECPYCKKEMEPGHIPAFRHRVTWLPGPPSPSLLDHMLDSGLDDEGRVWLSEYPGWKAQGAEAFLCRSCKTVLIPVKEFRDAFDKVGDKVDEIGEKLSGAFDRLTASGEENGARRGRDIKKGRDPWEL